MWHFATLPSSALEDVVSIYLPTAFLKNLIHASLNNFWSPARLTGTQLKEAKTGMFNNTIITLISSLLGTDAESAQLQIKNDLVMG